MLPRSPVALPPALLFTRAFLIAFLLALVSAWSLAQGAAPAGQARPELQVRAVEDVALRPVREAPASVVARNEARLAAEVSAPVLRWTADTGARVARGALLVELDASDLRLARDRARAALDASEARLQLAQGQLQRAQELVAEGFFSREALNARDTEVQLIRTELAANRAQLATAERALAKTRITAPFAASVKERLAQTGEFVAAGTPLYVLTQTDQMEVSAQIALAEVDDLRRSTQLVFAGEQGEVPLKLLRVAGSVSAPARTVEVRLAPARPLVVGSAGQLRWQHPKAHLPPAVMVRRGPSLGVFTVEGERARFVPLPGAQEGRAAPADLPAGSRLVTRGQDSLQDGQAVSIAR